jgi:hypothetical protein
MMNNQTRMNFVSVDAQVATVVSQYDTTAQFAPSFGCVEALIDPAIETEGLTSHLTVQR